jgi:predicted nucleotidyltransferase component of viral defense system
VIINNIKQASTEDIAYYEQILYPLQDKIFPLIQSDMLYLSGGNCLSRFYYHHRFSDDLDFFFDGYRNPKEYFEPVIREIINRIEPHYSIEMAVNSAFFKRLFLYSNQIPLKVEFIFENYKSAGNRHKIDDLFIDSKENIAANKLTAIQGRNSLKDFVDLYYLLGEIDFEEAAAWAESKIVPLDYEGLMTMFAGEPLEGQVLMKKPLTEEEISGFVNGLIRRLFDHAQRTG